MDHNHLVASIGKVYRAHQSTVTESPVISLEVNNSTVALLLTYGIRIVSRHTEITPLVSCTVLLCVSLDLI